MRNQGVKETEQLYRQRQGPREETIRTLKEGCIFDANDPERVRLTPR